MADKQLAYDTRGKNDLFADDDPLAELARIVGFEPRVAANTVTETARQEPAFDLEDELLREFERYDSPRPLAALDRPAEPVAEELAPYDFPEPPLEASPSVEEARAPEPVAAPSEPEPSAPALDVLAAADWAAAPAAQAGPAAPEVAAQPAFGGARDLIEELELSIGAGPTSPVPPAPKSPQWSASTIRLPLANFHAPRREEPARQEPVVETPVIETPVAEEQAASPQAVEPPVAETAAVEEPAVAADLSDEFKAADTHGFPAEIDRHEEVALAQVAAAVVDEEPPQAAVSDAGFDLAAAVEGMFKPDAALTQAEPIAFDSAGTFDLDDLLADVSRYPVPQRAAAEPQPEPELVSPVETAPVAAAPVVAAEPAPVEIAPAPAPVRPASAYVVDVPRPVAPAPVEAVSSQPVQATPRVQASEQDAEDPFAGHDFELDLAGIELELADLDFSETPQPAPAARPQPVPMAPVTPVAVSHPQPAPAFVPEPPAVAADNGSAAGAVDDLPFDPAMISDPEDRPETVEDMHVPALPPVEQPEPVAKAADFDFDLDAEIASFFEPAKTAEASAAPAWIAAAAAATPAKPGASDGLDEFERALEEDFRRSVREPTPRLAAVSEVRIESASQTADFNRARSMKRLLAAAAMLTVFVGGAYGVYAWVSNGPGLGGIISSGEPPVITADKEPVKVVPENPGGKTVPNQDKAVYDRVAGAAEEPKQKALVSSDEEPVDVVQKTLTPEVSSDDEEGGPVDDQIMPTAVGETEDPRLLPNENATDQAAADAERGPSVSPRKVRTMIVKPDGTLVAREEPADPAPAATAQAPDTQPATPSQGTAASFPTGTPANTEVASADGRPVAAAEQQAAARAAEAEVASAPAGDPPVRQVRTTNVADTAPIPAPRPAEQPVNVVGTVTENGNVRQAPTQVAAATPAAQPQQASAPGSYGIQIASLPSEAEANKSYANLSKKFAGVLGGRPYEIRKADIAGKGTFYRVRIPAGSKDEAAALCQQYRAAGGSCLISR
ncbi:SPOR domain-containing protein [Rhizobium binxianense]